MTRPDREGPDSFPTTNWPLVQRAADEAVSVRRPAQEELLRRYRPVLVAHLVHRRRMRPEDAEDLVQEFIARKILAGNILRLASAGQGRLRAYLLTALKNFLIDTERHRGATPPAAGLPAEVPAPAVPDEVDVTWAMQVVIEALRGMRAECAAKRRPDLLGIFAARFLGPLLGAGPVPDRLLAERFGLASSHQANNRYVTAVAMFRRNVRSVLADDSVEDADEQARELAQVVAVASAVLLGKVRIKLLNELPEVAMPPDDATPTDPAALARLLELPRPPVGPAALLQHCLAAPLPFDLGTGGEAPMPASLGELLHQPRPLPEVLEWAKDVAKDQATGAEKVGTVMYYACIAAALVRCGKRITTCDDATLRRGFEWGSSRPWVDEATRGLLREGLHALDGTEREPR
jgi:DNA-directed RNA polymerase specialized sigma24 family protein